MKHSIRINGVVKEIACELGSGILDKNGREIFEGDIVRICYNLYIPFLVLIENGVFVLNKKPLKEYATTDLEIVGHVDD